ncbi:MAG: hypothetical protein ACI93G_001249 [Hyphomonas sp.]
MFLAIIDGFKRSFLIVAEQRHELREPAVRRAERATIRLRFAAKAADMMMEAADKIGTLIRPLQELRPQGIAVIGQLAALFIAFLAVDEDLGDVVEGVDFCMEGLVGQVGSPLIGTMPNKRDTRRRVPTKMMKFWQAQGRPALRDIHSSAPRLSHTLVQPISRPRYTALMTVNSDLISHGLREASLALTNIIGLTNIHLKPLTLKRSLKQKAMARLKQLEMIVRRLLTLMTLALTLPSPLPTRAAPAPLRPVRKGAACRRSGRTCAVSRQRLGIRACARRALPCACQCPLQGAGSAGSSRQTPRAQSRPPA